MEYKTNVSFIDAHTESIRRQDQSTIALHKLFL